MFHQGIHCVVGLGAVVASDGDLNALGDGLAFQIVQFLDYRVSDDDCIGAGLLGDGDGDRRCFAAIGWVMSGGAVGKTGLFIGFRRAVLDGGNVLQK